MIKLDSWVQPALVLVLSGWAGYSCYSKGKAEGALHVQEGQLTALQHSVDSTKRAVILLDSTNRKLRRDVDSAHSRVVLVDKVQVANIDSALGVLKRIADSGTRALVQEVVTSYEERLATRDTLIDRLYTTIKSDSISIEEQRKLIALQDNVNHLRQDMQKSLERINRNSFGSDVIKVAAVVGGVLIVNAVTHH